MAVRGTEKYEVADVKNKEGKGIESPERQRDEIYSS